MNGWAAVRRTLGADIKVLNFSLLVVQYWIVFIMVVIQHIGCFEIFFRQHVLFWASESTTLDPLRITLSRLCVEDVSER